MIIIFWQISPTLHSGPIWYEYQDETAQCNTSWWRVFLLIDNWFEDGCYSFSWFIPAEIQLTLLNVLILLAFARKKKIGLVALGLTLLASWVLVLTISSPLPSSLETTLSYSAEKYFKSTYSHLPFYLFGVLNAYFAQNEKIKGLFQKLTENNILKFILLALGSFFILLVVYRPEVWDQVLGF
jgi:peptidoglycan/LPS O-acetylase OafA/YrhL